MRGLNMLTTNVRVMARVIVDPNSSSRTNRDLSVAGFEDADRVPEVGETVYAVQPDTDGSAFVGRAEVVRIDREYDLIYLRVFWNSFVDEPAPVIIGAVTPTETHFFSHPIRRTRTTPTRNGIAARIRPVTVA